MANYSECYAKLLDATKELENAALDLRLASAALRSEKNTTWEDPEDVWYQGGISELANVVDGLNRQIRKLRKNAMSGR